MNNSNNNNIYHIIENNKYDIKVSFKFHKSGEVSQFDDTYNLLVEDVNVKQFLKAFDELKKIIKTNIKVNNE